MILAVIFRTLAGMLSIPVDFEADRGYSDVVQHY